MTYEQRNSFATFHRHCKILFVVNAIMGVVLGVNEVLVLPLVRIDLTSDRGDPVPKSKYSSEIIVKSMTDILHIL